MANEMIKFFRGLEASLPTSGVNGGLYITTDEGGIYLGTGTGMKRLGDFVQVANVASLPEKAHESCLYYCVAENILAKWNGTEWKQVNKQPTVDELKTLLGLGSLAYKSEVAEGDLNADLKAKVNAAAEGNHAHENKTVLDGITADKVSAWDAAEQNAKDYAEDYADGLNTAMNTRVEALEAIDHEHSNKALLDTYTQTEVDLADAVAKKHEHANAAELAKIVDGDKAKWDAVAADHLTSADKTTLENSIKEAKKAGTDANTNIETYKVANDARVLAVEEDIADIIDDTNGILAQAKSYSDGKLATAKTEISAEIDADVKVVNDALEAYKTSNDSALAGVKATAEAAATKAYTDEELGKKVDKVEGKSLVSDSEITKLAGVSEGANKVENSEVNGNIKIDGVETTVYTHPDKHAIGDVDGLQAALDGKQAVGDYATKAEAQGYADAKDDAIAAALKAGTDAQTHSEGVAGNLATHITEADGKYETKEDAGKKLTEAKGYTDTEVAKVQGEVDALEEYVGTIPTDEKYADVTNVIGYINKKAEETLSAAQGGSSETAASVKQQLDNYKSENDTRVKATEDAIDAIEADYLKGADKTELAGLISAEETRAKGVEEGLADRVKTIEDDYLKKADKDALQEQINTIMNNPDAEGAINSINEFTQYVKDHGTIAEGFRTDINANEAAIEAEVERAGEAESALSGRLDTLEAIDHDAYKAADTTLKGEVIGASGDASTADTIYGAKKYADEKASAAQAAAESTAAGALSTAKSELEGKITAAEGKVTALEQGAVATNAANIEQNAQDIALKANSADVYLKTETYNKTEIDALFTWGTF